MDFEIFKDIGTYLFLYMTVWSMFAIFYKRNDMADSAWGLGFVFVAWLSFYISGYSIIGMLVTILVTIWGVRLAYHISFRNIKKTEDERYAKWRLEWGKWADIRSYFQVFMLQGILLFLISLSTIFINSSGLNAISIYTILGVFVWIVGFVFESVGDMQLKNFIKDPLNRGKIMNLGLWKYTRHPNYFGEITMWWGIWIIALQIPNGIYTIISPLLISYLIIKVSGVPMLEKNLEKNPLFAEYKAKTSILIPWFPKK